MSSAKKKVMSLRAYQREAQKIADRENALQEDIKPVAEAFKDRIKQKGFPRSRIEVKKSPINVARTPLRTPERIKTPDINMSEVYTSGQTGVATKRIKQLQRFQNTNNLNDAKMKELITKLANEAETKDGKKAYMSIARNWKALPTETIEQAIKDNNHIDLRLSKRQADESRKQGRSEFI